MQLVQYLTAVAVVGRRDASQLGAKVNNSGDIQSSGIVG